MCNIIRPICNFSEPFDFNTPDMILGAIFVYAQSFKLLRNDLIKIRNVKTPQYGAEGPISGGPRGPQPSTGARKKGA